MATSNFSSKYSSEVCSTFNGGEIEVLHYTGEEPCYVYRNEATDVPTIDSDELIEAPTMDGFTVDNSDEFIEAPTMDGFTVDNSDEFIEVSTVDGPTEYSDELIETSTMDGPTIDNDELIEAHTMDGSTIDSDEFIEASAVDGPTEYSYEVPCSEKIATLPTAYNEYGYIFVHPLPEKYICGICKNILSQPHVTECCGQHFCEDCLKKSASQNTIQHWSTQSRLRQNRHSTHYRQYVKSQTSNCPHCRQNNFNHIRYLPFKREIDSMKVHCPRKSSGCNLHVAYGNREDHDKTCGYIRVVCTNKCGKTVFKKDLQSHTRNDCTLRRVTCKACGKIGTYKDIESLGHNFVCPEVWVKCGNSCGARFKRKAARSHDLVCLEATVDCQFAEAGCTVKPKRKDLESHLDASMKKHLSQLMTAHVKMKQEFQAFKENHRHGEKDQPATSAPSQTRKWSMKHY